MAAPAERAGKIGKLRRGSANEKKSRQEARLRKSFRDAEARGMGRFVSLHGASGCVAKVPWTFQSFVGKDFEKGDEKATGRAAGYRSAAISRRLPRPQLLFHFVSSLFFFGATLLLHITNCFEKNYESFRWGNKQLMHLSGAHLPIPYPSPAPRPKRRQSDGPWPCSFFGEGERFKGWIGELGSTCRVPAGADV